jgi:glycosyltransferase involved in cell wall biosynthesis
MKPTISVIIPVYNAELYIDKAISSVLNQSFSDFELLVIDDGSTDFSSDIIKNIQDTRLQYYFKKNEGQCKALNLGISKAEGRFIKFLDADDYLDECHLERMLDVVYNQHEQDRDSMLILSKWQRFSGLNNFWPIAERPEWCNCLPFEFVEKALGNGPDMLPGWQWLIPRKILNKAGFWNEELGLGNDFDFSIRLILASEGIRFCNNSVVYYRSDLKQNMSSDKSIDTILSVLRAARLGVDNILSLNNSDNLKKVCSSKLKVWLVTYYPYLDNAIVNDVQNQIKELGPSSINLNWSFKLSFIEKLFGWKVARMLQYYYYKALKIA